MDESFPDQLFINVGLCPDCAVVSGFKKTKEKTKNVSVEIIGARVSFLGGLFR